jgi:hypothetical protein
MISLSYFTVVNFLSVIAVCRRLQKGGIFFSFHNQKIIIIPAGVRPLVVREILALLPLLFFIAVFDDHEHECTMMVMMIIIIIHAFFFRGHGEA